MNEIQKYLNVLNGHGKAIFDDNGRMRYKHTIEIFLINDESVYINPNKLIEI